MKINIRDMNGNILILNVDPNTKIQHIMEEIKSKLGIEPFEQELMFSKRSLHRNKSIKDYQIKEHSTINLSFKLIERGIPAKEESKVIGQIKNDTNQTLHFLIPGKLTKRYIRNTNATGVYEQTEGNCYAFAACSAYINTIIRIYGSRSPPSFKECFKIANYNGGNGGYPEESIKRLENHFHYGILCKRVNSVSIRDILTISVLCNFHTSQDGWESVACEILLIFNKLHKLL